MPASPINTFSNQGLQPINDRGMKAEQFSVKLTPTQTLAKGTVMGQVTTGGLYKAYASGNADGSQIPVGLLAYDVVVDASGNCTIGGGDQGITYPTAPMFSCGEFSCADLTGLDAGGVTAGGWKLMYGSVSTGAVRLPA